jgi:hypothetical protein
MRQKACDYLEQNGRLFDDKQSSEIITPDYIAKMRRTSEWGGGIEIRALCEQLNLIVVVSGPATKRPIVFKPLQPRLGTRHVFLTYNGSHYEPMPPFIFEA